MISKKSSSTQNPNNYCSFGITSCVGKLLERNLENLINKYLKEVGRWLFKWKMKITIEKRILDPSKRESSKQSGLQQKDSAYAVVWVESHSAPLWSLSSGFVNPNLHKQ
ncbi:hypothetical protein BpHYR1_006026 [Brachionus plicatilis]|uniref:RNA-directed DNA polymerase from mobile element jockey-like n=1 Tax=Brachionus plicatilis TaxID=10195 RepID=A0A3M7PYQ1_BRAPC|nr:hypothetical protein BpHYR1_006026 [Brachionus plicatilis]